MRRAALFAFLATAPLTAAAHLESTGLGPFYDGVAHLLRSPDDLLPVVAMALLAGQNGVIAGRCTLFVLTGAWMAGAFAGYLVARPIAPGAATLVSLLVLGILVASDRRMPATLVTGIAVAVGLLHGSLNGTGIAAARGDALAIAGIATAVFSLAAFGSALVVSHHAAWARIAVLAIVSLPALAQHHWGYEGEAGPANWSKLDPKNVMCALGKNQSPIDLANFVEADLKPLKLDYKAGASEIVNNGHTIQVNYAAGSTLTVDGRSFELKQFHFHAPSENRVGGKQFPLEGHLVHADKDGNLAVVAVMFEDGAANPVLEKAWAAMPAKAGGKAPLPAGINVTAMLPADKDYYRFNGSLTTPPCSEGVWWLVAKKPATVSKAQVEKFSKTVGFANNRPIQARNARPVLQ
jgi:carbonic anhydrase